jgi:hypothetical protein
MYFDDMKRRLLSDHGQELRERLRSVPGVAAMAARMDPVATATGDVGEYDTFTLLEVLYAPQNAPELAGFWLKWFDQTITFETEEIRFDSEDLNEYRLAPFVSPNVQGRVMRSKGFNVKSFRPAYAKPKHVVDPSRTIPRRAGERIGGTLSLQQRFDAIVADNLRRERLMIENRWDWMACRAIVDSSVTVIGEDYPAQTVDFNRDPSLTIVAAGAASWSQTTASPMTDIRNARQQSFRLSKAPVANLIFGLDAWNAFTDPSHTDVQRLLDNLRRGSESDFNILGVQEGGPYEYQGTISGFQGAGRLALWTYNNLYEDSSGLLVPYMDQGSVIGIGSVTKGIQCFGAIRDRRALQALAMFPKQWDEEDPSVSYTMTQSAPLMVPLRPNNSFKLKVV